MKTVAITGANGFLGSALVEQFSKHGYVVRKLIRDPLGAQSYSYDLEEGVSKEALSGVDILIHTAHDFTVFQEEQARLVNREGSRKLFEQASEAGVSVILFVSSVSAFPGCSSVYGKTKLETEQIVSSFHGKSVRPGLIYGKKGKGMFGSLEMVVRRLPVIPLFDGGTQQLVVVHVDDLSSGIVWATEHWSDVPEVFTLASDPSVTFRELLESMARISRKRRIFISVPSAFALAGLALLEKLGIHIRFRRDSLVSLLNVDPELGRNRLPQVPTRKFTG